MKKRTLLATAILTSALLIAPDTAQARDNVANYEQGPIPITVHADGEFVPMDVEPIIIEGRTMVPLRAAGEAVGAQIDWDQTTQTASANINGRSVQFTIDSNTYYVNGSAETTDVAPVNRNGRTLLPLRAFGDACGLSVEWDNELRDVQIDTEKEDVVPLLPAGCPDDLAVMIRKYYVQNVPGTMVGNWRTETTISQSPAGGAETCTKYLFISDKGDRYQGVQILTKRATYYDGTGMCVQKLEGLFDFNSNAIFSLSDSVNPSAQEDFNKSLLYFNIPGNGIPYGVKMNDSQYELRNLNLVMTSEYQGWYVGWQARNEVYSRF